MSTGPWASLFSGGKDSSFVVYRALESGRDVTRLVTVDPGVESYLYHVPDSRVVGLAAESIGIPLLEVKADVSTCGEDSGVIGNRELEPLEETLRRLVSEEDLAGITTGAVASEYQASRLRAMCERLGIEMFAPLWGRDAHGVVEEMLDARFEIMISHVAAAGLDEAWLGRIIDDAALAELVALNDEYGVHVLGEGGEFETVVLNGPHMDRPLRVEYTTQWDGSRGRLEVTRAWLRGDGPDGDPG